MYKMFLDGYAALNGAATAEDFAPYLEWRSLRRMEGMAKDALLCSCRALEQAGIDINTPKDMGLSIAVGGGALESTCKFMDSILSDGDELSSPTAFAGSVHNSTGLALSLFLHMQGPCVTIGQFDFSFPAALLTAGQFLQSGACRQSLVVVAEDVNPVLADCAPQYGAQFKSIVRQPNGPFVRRSAAFVVSVQPTPFTRWVLHDISFLRTDKEGQETLPPAEKLARLLADDCAFELHDLFAGAELCLKGEPYVKPK